MARKYVAKIFARLTIEEDMALRAAANRLGLRRATIIRRMVIDFIDADQRSRESRHFSLQRASVRREAERQEAAFT